MLIVVVHMQHTSIFIYAALRSDYFLSQLPPKVCNIKVNNVKVYISKVDVET